MAAGCSTGSSATHEKAVPQTVDYGRRGPHPVGSTTLDGAGGSIEVFYPAAEDSGPEAVPSAEGPFPVVVHSHDGGSDRLSSSRHLTNVASWGLVAAATLATSLRVLTDATIERGSPLEGVIDTERVGVEGHGSGATSARAFAADPQVDVVALLAPEPTDPTSWPQAVDQPLLVVGTGRGTAADLGTAIHGVDDPSNGDTDLAVLAGTDTSVFIDDCQQQWEDTAPTSGTTRSGDASLRSGAPGCDSSVDVEPARLWPVIDHLTTARYLSTLGADGGAASTALDPGFVTAAHPGALSGHLHSGP